MSLRPRPWTAKGTCVYDADGKLIVDFGSVEGAEQTARLAAAGPDTLAELKDAVKWIDELGPFEVGGGERNPRMAMSAYRAAIEKAEPESDEVTGSLKDAVHTPEPWNNFTVAQVPAGVRSSAVDVPYRAMSEPNYQYAKERVNACAGINPRAVADVVRSLRNLVESGYAKRDTVLWNHARAAVKLADENRV